MFVLVHRQPRVEGCSRGARFHAPEVNGHAVQAIVRKYRQPAAATYAVTRKHLRETIGQLIDFGEGQRFVFEQHRRARGEVARAASDQFNCQHQISG